MLLILHMEVQNLIYFVVGFGTCYLKNKYDVTNEYILSKSIDYYVDGKCLINNVLKSTGLLKQISTESTESTEFWDEIRTKKEGDKYCTTYKKDGRWYHALHDEPSIELSRNMAIDDLEVVEIKSEYPLTNEENKLVKLLVSQWSGYAGDFHNNEIYLENILGLSNIIETRKIDEIIVNTNMITETTISKST